MNLYCICLIAYTINTQTSITIQIKSPTSDTNFTWLGHIYEVIIKNIKIK